MASGTLVEKDGLLYEGVIDVGKSPNQTNGGANTDISAFPAVIATIDAVSTYPAFNLPNMSGTVQVTTSATAQTTINIQVSNDNSGWITLGTFILAGDALAETDGFAFDARWAYMRAKSTVLSGNGVAIVSLNMGE